MARPAPSSRRAPLPADAEARLHRTVGLRLSATLDDPELVSLVEALCVPWLLAGRDRLRLDCAKRLRLAPDADRAIKRLARSLRLMASNDQCGQQAGQAASKTLRAVRTRRVDMDGLLQLETGYRSLRREDRRRHGSPKIHAPDDAEARGAAGVAGGVPGQSGVAAGLPGRLCGREPIVHPGLVRHRADTVG